MSEHFDPWSLNSPSIFDVPFVLDSLNGPFYFHSLHTILFFIIFTIFFASSVSLAKPFHQVSYSDIHLWTAI